jgi:hypothetical protein
MRFADEERLRFLSKKRIQDWEFESLMNEKQRDELEILLDVDTVEQLDEICSFLNVYGIYDLELIIEIYLKIKSKIVKYI